MRKPLRSPVAIALLLLSGLLASANSLSHDIPARMEIYSFVNQEPEELQVLMRLPLTLLLNVNLPKRGPGYLDLAIIAPDLDRAANVVAGELPFYANGERLVPTGYRTQLALPSSDAFSSYDRALAHFADALPSEDTNIFWNQGYFDIHLTYPLPADETAIAFEMTMVPGLAGQIHLLLEFRSRGGEVTSYVLHHGMGQITLNPGWIDVAQVFAGLGFSYPFYSLIHLVFLLCLLIPFGARNALYQALIILGFAVGQGLALVYCVLASLTISQEFQALVEFIASLLLAMLAIQNIVTSRPGYRLIAGLLGGLALGLLFVNELRSDLQLNGGLEAVSLTFFNIGLVAALAAIAIAANPIIRLLHRTRRSGRYAVLIVSGLVLFSAWHWLTDRYSYLQRNWAFISWRFSFEDMLFTAFFLLLAISTVWFAYEAAKRLRLGRSG